LNSENIGTISRRVLQVRTEKFDVKSKDEFIRKAVDSLSEYLDTFMPKGRWGTSKYSLEGPAGKLISLAKSEKISTKEALVGQITTIHENTGNRLTIESLDKLEKSVDNILQVLKDVPPTKRLKVLSEVDYGLYFKRKKKLLEMLSQNLEKWIAFLKNRYQIVDALNKTWSLSLEGKVRAYSDFSKVDWPTASFERKFQGNEQALKDFSEFKSSLKLPVIEEEELEEDQEGVGEESGDEEAE
jgi:hypothetical protein